MNGFRLFLTPSGWFLGLGLFQNMFHNLLIYTSNFFLGYITVSCFFETFPAGRLDGISDFNDNPVVSSDLDFGLQLRVCQLKCWNEKLKFKSKIEIVIENWNWSYKWKSETWSWNWIENWNWKSKLKIRIGNWNLNMAGWTVGTSNFNEKPVVSLDLDLDFGLWLRVCQKSRTRIFVQHHVHWES